LTLVKLTYLELWNTMISNITLAELYTMAPNLQCLKYRIGGPCRGYEEFGPQVLLNATLSHAQNLKCLVFDGDQWAKNAQTEDEKRVPEPDE
ncbi:hypothetical protein QBC36DRAFT_179764, partial [Triangularia setosa]